MPEQTEIENEKPRGCWRLVQRQSEEGIPSSRPRLQLTVHPTLQERLINEGTHRDVLDALVKEPAEDDSCREWDYDIPPSMADVNDLRTSLKPLIDAFVQRAKVLVATHSGVAGSSGPADSCSQTLGTGPDKSTDVMACATVQILWDTARTAGAQSGALVSKSHENGCRMMKLVQEERQGLHLCKTNVLTDAYMSSLNEIQTSLSTRHENDRKIASELVSLAESCITDLGIHDSNWEGLVNYIKGQRSAVKQCGSAVPSAETSSMEEEQLVGKGFERLHSDFARIKKEYRDAIRGMASTSTQKETPVPTHALDLKKPREQSKDDTISNAPTEQTEDDPECKGYTTAELDALQLEKPEKGTAGTTNASKTKASKDRARRNRRKAKLIPPLPLASGSSSLSSSATFAATTMRSPIPTATVDTGDDDEWITVNRAGRPISSAGKRPNHSSTTAEAGVTPPRNAAPRPAHRVAPALVPMALQQQLAAHGDATPSPLPHSSQSGSLDIQNLGLQSLQHDEWPELSPLNAEDKLPERTVSARSASGSQNTAEDEDRNHPACNTVVDRPPRCESSPTVTGEQLGRSSGSEPQIIEAVESLAITDTLRPRPKINFTLPDGYDEDTLTQFHKSQSALSTTTRNDTDSSAQAGPPILQHCGDVHVDVYSVPPQRPPPLNSVMPTQAYGLGLDPRRAQHTHSSLAAGYSQPVPLQHPGHNQWVYPSHYQSGGPPSIHCPLWWQSGHPQAPGMASDTFPKYQLMTYPNDDVDAPPAPHNHPLAAPAFQGYQSSDGPLPHPYGSAYYTKGFPTGPRQH